MKQVNYPGRSRGRSLEQQRKTSRKSSSDRSHESGIRSGSAQNAVDKYLMLARDAKSMGDIVGAELFYQYADHYHRMLVETRAHKIREKPQQEQTEVKSPTCEEEIQPQEEKVDA